MQKKRGAEWATKKAGQQTVVFVANGSVWEWDGKGKPKKISKTRKPYRRIVTAPGISAKCRAGSHGSCPKANCSCACHRRSNG